LIVNCNTFEKTNNNGEISENRLLFPNWHFADLVEFTTNTPPGMGQIHHGIKNNQLLDASARFYHSYLLPLPKGP
jgi:hypothetical protein